MEMKNIEKRLYKVTEAAENVVGVTFNYLMYFKTFVMRLRRSERATERLWRRENKPIQHQIQTRGVSI